MRSRLLLAVLSSVVVCSSAFAQDTWTWSHRLELRGDYRWSDDERFNRPFPPGAVQSTPDPGHHVELNVAELQLDLGYGEWIAARVKAHGYAKHRRNPTSADRTSDIDEIFVRIGPAPEFLRRPNGTTFFLQAGKFPKMERQPTRLLESYGLAATSFNRFEDVQVLVGGTIGRNLYWRAVAANGNPLFMRDPNALAGDNGVCETGACEVEYGTGFPILYNAETEDLFFSTKHVQIGEALGYRWQREDQTMGFDLIVFHYEREMAETEDLTGTFYGGDLDLLSLDEIGRPDLRLPFTGDKKKEYGARLYGEWYGLTSTLQFTKQNLAGLQREGWEGEVGYRFPLRLGPIESIQPAVRASGLTNRFLSPVQWPAPSMRWQWTKWDGGVRVGLTHGLDVTLEYTKHNIGTAAPIELRETLVTVRWRV